MEKNHLTPQELLKLNELITTFDSVLEIIYRVIDTDPTIDDPVELEKNNLAVIGAISLVCVPHLETTSPNRIQVILNAISLLVSVIKNIEVINLNPEKINDLWLYFHMKFFELRSLVDQNRN